LPDRPDLRQWDVRMKKARWRAGFRGGGTGI